MASILWNGRVGFLESGRRKYQFDCISAERGRRLRSSRAACVRCVEWIGRFRCVGLGGQGPRSASAATGRGQETEARGWRTEDRGRRTEDRGRRPDGGSVGLLPAGIGNSNTRRSRVLRSEARKQPAHDRAACGLRIVRLDRMGISEVQPPCGPGSDNRRG